MNYLIGMACIAVTVHAIAATALNLRHLVYYYFEWGKIKAKEDTVWLNVWAKEVAQAVATMQRDKEP